MVLKVYMDTSAISKTHILPSIVCILQCLLLSSVLRNYLAQFALSCINTDIV